MVIKLKNEIITGHRPWYITVMLIYHSFSDFDILTYSIEQSQNVTKNSLGAKS